jgi:penicillin-binding protein 1A
LGQLNYGVTLRELSTAYTVFADEGSYHPYRSYYRVLDSNGNILLSNADASEPVISKENAAIMTKLLEEVVHSGTSSSITLEKKTECAGKTGTTHNDFDRWFIGYTPELICGVWCGYEYPEPLVGRNLCTSIWDNVMGMILATGHYETKFKVPESVIQASYCKDSGMLIDEACTLDPRGNRGETGYFVKGSEPKAYCNCHILCDYDAEYGGISHGNCHTHCTEKVGLIQTERRFPIQILVTDAQYVYRGDPLEMPINEDPSKPYFASSLEHFCGISPGNAQFNRSCQEHLYQEDAPSPEYWFSQFFDKPFKRIKRKHAS